MSTLYIGIDLGTTRCSLSYVDPTDGLVKDFRIAQWTANERLEDLALLPSFAYRLNDSDGSLPDWNSDKNWAIGEFAKKKSCSNPDRVISSAKSWLAFGRGNRDENTLPERAPAEQRLSPIDASALYLKQLKDAWDAHRPPGLPTMSEAQIVVTVPASFDAVSREFTALAIQRAGITVEALLEEPQAALYSWLDLNPLAFKEQMSVGQSLLVIDIGGGTTDFVAVKLDENDGKLSPTRIAVGDHILLGGDNMDLALAQLIKQKLGAAAKSLTLSQQASIIHEAREAKEKLLSGLLESCPIAIGAAGASLFGNTLKAELSRAEVENFIVEGFFPHVPKDTDLHVTSRAGLRRQGLPFAEDPAITKHLLRFLLKSGKDGQLFMPDWILFNGGVSNSQTIQVRLQAQLSEWAKQSGHPIPQVLPGADADRSVSRGAARFAQSRSEGGLTIRGGSAHSYYIGVESNAPSIPGFPPVTDALCIIPPKAEEGISFAIHDFPLGLLTGEKAHFRLFRSSHRPGDNAGLLLENWEDHELEELPQLETELDAYQASSYGSELVEVHIQAQLSSLGVLDVRAIESNGHEWRLFFELSDAEQGSSN